MGQIKSFKKNQGERSSVAETGLISSRTATMITIDKSELWTPLKTENSDKQVVSRYKVNTPRTIRVYPLQQYD